jgi:hypothetical protein
VVDGMDEKTRGALAGNLRLRAGQPVTIAGARAAGSGWAKRLVSIFLG